MSELRKVHLDRSQSLNSKGEGGHNRWHYNIEPLLKVDPEQSVSLDVRDGLDGQITTTSTPRDLASLNLDVTHPMTGPIYVNGAEPGDLLTVEILSITTADDGWTFVMPGMGLLADRLPGPYLIHWGISDGYATSQDLPGVMVPGRPFLGVVGVAPSPTRLAQILAREGELARSGFPVRLPKLAGAIPSTIEMGQEGLRSAPPREIGGNLDIRHMGDGTRLTLPVDVAGALCSVGDMHFAQGDGEVCGTAIEVSGSVDLIFHITKSKHVTWRPTNPYVEFVQTKTEQTRSYVGTVGYPLGRDGSQSFMDLHLAARRAIEEMITYVCAAHKLSEYQAYLLLSATCNLQISQMVDCPNAIVLATLPTDIFV